MAQAAPAAAPATLPETVSVEAAARRLGLSRSLAYELARTGELCRGVPVLRFGARKLVVPRRAIDAALGVADESPGFAPSERVA